MIYFQNHKNSFHNWVDRITFRTSSKVKVYKLQKAFDKKKWECAVLGLHNRQQNWRPQGILKQNFTFASGTEHIKIHMWSENTKWLWTWYYMYNRALIGREAWPLWETNNMRTLIYRDKNIPVKIWKKKTKYSYFSPFYGWLACFLSN